MEAACNNQLQHMQVYYMLFEVILKLAKSHLISNSTVYCTYLLGTCSWMVEL